MIHDITQRDRTLKDDVDGVLSDFFKADMPSAWPQASEAIDRSMRPDAAVRPARFAAYRRLALAASIILMLFGYLSLAENFPKDSSTDKIDPVGPVIGDQKIRQDKTRSGRPVEVQEIVPGANGARPQVIRIDVRELPSTPNKQR